MGVCHVGAIALVETKVIPKLPDAIAKPLQEFVGKARKKLEELMGANKVPKKDAPEPEKPKGKKEDNAQVKGKKKLKCGEYGKYGKLKEKTGEGKFHRDHIPSKQALKERARALNGGKRLTPSQQKAIDNWGNAIAIPRQAHIDVSPTYGGRNGKLAALDATDLASAARRDVEAMLKQIDEYDADGGCKRAYRKAAKRVLKLSKKEFDAELLKLLKQKR